MTKKSKVTAILLVAGLTFWAGAGFASRLLSERSQPRSGDIFVNIAAQLNPNSGGAAYSVAHKWAKRKKNRSSL